MVGVSGMTGERLLPVRSEEHTSELQSQSNLVCRLLLEKKMVLTLVFPPLLLYGAPVWVVRPLLGPGWVLRVAHRATRPLAAGALFSAPITLWHVRQFYEAALEHHPLHIAQPPVSLAPAGVL